MLKKSGIEMAFLSMSIAAVLMGYNVCNGQENFVNIENKSIIDTNMSETDNTRKDPNLRYEYYLTEEGLITDIEQGYIFRLDTEFKKPIVPYVSQGEWSFYVHEENTVNLEIEFSNLLMKPKENIFPMDEQIIVEVISPDEKSVYRFEKVGDEIIKDTSIQEKISVTQGEYMLRISFGYYCGNTPAHLKIAAAYEAPSEEDISWLKEKRRKNI